MSTAETNLNDFLQDYRITTTSVESVDLNTDRLYKTITIGVEQKRKMPRAYFTRGVIPYFAPLDDKTLFTAGMTQGDLAKEHSLFRSGMTFMYGLSMEAFYDMGELSDSEHGTIGYSPGGVNMYGAFKVMYDRYQFVSQYPVFYSITAGNDPYAVASFTGVTEKGASGGCYTMVNFGGTIVPFQLMFDASTLGISNSNGLPTGTAGNPLYYGLSANTGLTSAVKSLYFIPDIPLSLRRNIALYKDRGVTFAGFMARFEPHYQFIKYADDAFLDTRADMINAYVGLSANPAWTEELRRFNGSTSAINRVGFQLANDFNNKFFDEIQKYPARYNLVRNSQQAGHWGVPYVTEVLGWQKSIPNPGYAADATGPFIPVGQQFYVSRIAQVTFKPAPAGYTFSTGMTGWQSYTKGLGTTTDTSFHPEYFMMGGSANAASSTYSASDLIPANILTYFSDNYAGIGPDGTTLNFLESYYYDLYAETLLYGGYRYQNNYFMHFVPKFNPMIPVQQKGTYSARNYASRRDSTIHRDFGNTSAERLSNLKNSMRSSINAAMRAWKLLLDGVGKFNHRIIPVLQGRNEDYDLTRGGCVPYSPADFVEYLMAPLFTGDVPANGFIMNDDTHEKLLNGFYYGNIARGSGEYTKVVTNKGVSGSDPTTSFIRGLETYFFDLEKLQDSMSFRSYLADLGITASIDLAEYMSNFNSGRFSDLRVFETNTGTTGGNSYIPYGNFGPFQWNLVPIRQSSILYTNDSLRDRWGSTANAGITTAYTILRDAYFELTKQQLQAAFDYFENDDITTFTEYRSTDKQIGR
jgi:hypothetical protein